MTGTVTLTDVHSVPLPVASGVLWDLLQERPDYANISHDKLTTRRQHDVFVLGHPYREWCLIMRGPDTLNFNLDCKWVGAIYITHQNELGIGILKAHQRNGYARQAIEAMMDRHPRKCYFANVAPANHPSHRLWESFQDHAIVQLTYKVTRGESNGNRSSNPTATP